MHPNHSWQTALTLNSSREVTAGSSQTLTSAIARGADLRIYTEFLHNEHIDPASTSNERIREVAEFGVTMLVENEWAAGIMSLRQPIELPVGFGPRPSMSFFLYNQDGTQAIARPFLDGPPIDPNPGPGAVVQPVNMPKYHQLDNWDMQTNAPSHNFVYDFDVFRFCVCDTWTEVLHHTADGQVLAGSIKSLVDAFSSGCAIKLGISGLCSDLADSSEHLPNHEVFVQGGSAYYYTEQQLFMIGSHPIVRVTPGIPLRYRSGNWDFGWLMVRSDGRVVYRRCDPLTLKFTDHVMQLGVRWFVR
jgi:hypothetical protein